MNRREFLATAVAIGARRRCGAADPPVADTASLAGETLYNGIRLPAAWPPKLDGPLDTTVPPPYLKDPPPIIPIDLGRPQSACPSGRTRRSRRSRGKTRPSRERPAGPCGCGST